MTYEDFSFFNETFFANSMILCKLYSITAFGLYKWTENKNFDSFLEVFGIPYSDKLNFEVKYTDLQTATLCPAAMISNLDNYENPKQMF